MIRSFAYSIDKNKFYSAVDQIARQNVFMITLLGLSCQEYNAEKEVILALPIRETMDSILATLSIKTISSSLVIL